MQKYIHIHVADLLEYAYTYIHIVEIAFVCKMGKLSSCIVCQSQCLPDHCNEGTCWPSPVPVSAAAQHGLNVISQNSQSQIQGLWRCQ